MWAVNECIVRVREKPLPPAMGGGRGGGSRHTPSQAELKKLAEQTLANTNKTLQALADELRRMARRVVDTDHPTPEEPDYCKMYSLHVLPSHLATSSSSSSGSSSGFSSSDESCQ
jgi:hypothetical protein